MKRVHEYWRPASLEAALALLARATPATKPLAGGTYLALANADVGALVDLAGLNLAGIKSDGGYVTVGAMTTLQALGEAAEICGELRRAAQREAPRNIRNQATLGGTVALGNSGPLLVCLLALEARLTLEPGGETVALADYLKRRISYQAAGTLIVAVSYAGDRGLAYEEIARTPADAPIMCLAAAAVSGEGRLAHVMLACGGAGQPLETGEAVGQTLEGVAVAAAAEQASRAAGAWQVAWTDDVRGQAAYRQAMLPVLLRRAAGRLAASAAEVDHED